MKKIKFILMLIYFCLLVVGCQRIVEKEEQEETVELEEVEKEEEEKQTEAEEEKEEKPIEEMIVTSERDILNLAESTLADMSLEEKVGQLFIVNLELLDSTKGSFFEFRELTKEMKKTLEKYPIGGICFFSRNIETRDQVVQLIEDLQNSSETPLFIAVDEEGGSVARIGNNENMRTTKFPTMEEIGENETEEYAHQMGQTIGKEMKELGFNLNFAPVADVKTNELNMEIGDRSFGSDAKLVAKLVKQVVLGIQEENVSAALKHFPGHGDAGKDTHEGAVNVDNDMVRLRKVEFLPFETGIKAGVDFVMVSHISISRITEDTLPASLSELVMKDMLRNELSFNGIVITDAMDMKAITDRYTTEQATIKAIQSGADIILMPQDLEAAYQAVLNAVEDGDILEEQIDESVKRILYIKIKRGLYSEVENKNS